MKWLAGLYAKVETIHPIIESLQKQTLFSANGDCFVHCRFPGDQAGQENSCETFAAKEFGRMDMLFGV